MSQEQSSRKQPEFQAFLSAHPYSRLDKIESPVKTDVIFSPWGDDSLIFYLASDSRELSDALNKLILPERLSALYHVEQRKLEVIYTAFQLRNYLVGRSFNYVFYGIKHECKFGPCSQSLLVLAENVRPSETPTRTDYRNLLPIRYYVAKMGGDSQYKDMPLAHPTSFWVDNLDWDEDAVVALCRNLNFYMAYYDNKTPTVLFHTKKSESITVQPQSQFRHNKFPANIIARSQEEELLHFWHASRAGDPARRFLYNYQILEYLAHHIVDDDVRKRMRRALLAPHALDVVDTLVDQMLDASASIKMHDAVKVETLLTQTVNSQMVWAEIQRNMALFEKPTVFDGGFEVKPIVRTGMDEKAFESAWAGPFAKALRDIRNGLSHSKESRMEVGIPPTHSNLQKLQNWVTLISIAATEAMVFRTQLS
jgi:hypothetical protein